MVDFLNETRVTFGQLARLENVAPSTVWRWCQRGVRGVRLECFVIGGRRFTTRESFRRFVLATTAAAVGHAPAGSVATSRQRQAAIAAAERELRDAGV